MENGKKVSLVEKLGYASGDLACNLVFQTVSIFLLIFYTDVFGISAAAAATLFLVARLWDAINDPIMGAIVDKTKTRWGKFRPFLLWGAIPYGLIAILCFTTPNFSAAGKLIYAYVTYIGLGMVYTFINVPYGALTSSMTQDPVERTSISAIRMFFALIGGLIVSGVPTLSNLFGKGNAALGYQVTMIVFAIIGTFLLFVTFFTTKERHTIKENNHKVNLSQTIKVLKANSPLKILSLIFILFFATNTISSAVSVYFFKYNLNSPATISLYISSGIIVMMATLLFIPLMLKRIEKKRLLILGTAIGLFKPISMLFLSIPIIFAGNIIGSIGFGIVVGLLWGLVPDTIEYGQYKTGIRAEGMVYAIVGFAFKLGMALGGLVPGYVLEWTGYVPNSAQNNLTLSGIASLVSIIPIVFFLLIIICMKFYRLNEETYRNIVFKLNQKGV